MKVQQSQSKPLNNKWVWWSLGGVLALILALIIHNIPTDAEIQVERERQRGIINSSKSDNINTAPSLEGELTLILEHQYNNFANNTLVRDKAFSRIKVVIDSLAPTGVLETIPMSVFKVYKNPYGKGAIVHLYSNNILNVQKQHTNYLCFDIIGFASEEIASEINENKEYTLSGKFLKRVDQTELDLITSDSYYGAEQSMKTYPRVEIHVGAFLYEINDLALVEKSL